MASGSTELSHLRRVDRGKLLARFGRNKLVVDKQTNGLSVLTPIGGRQLYSDVRHDGWGAVKESTRK